MEEIIRRRFKRALSQSKGFAILPDLIMIDGGKGQINIALGVLEELNLNIPVCGFSKR